MKNVLRLLTLTLLFVPGLVRAQEWTEVPRPYDLQFEGWVDLPPVGVHGLTLDGNGRLWVCQFFNGRLQVLNADGTPADISPVDTLVTVGINTGNCRGINTDHEGNIIAVLQNSRIVRLNADTGEVIDWFEGPGSLTQPAVDAEGYVYVSTVVGAEPIRVLELPSYTEVLAIQDESDFTWWSRADDVTEDGLRVVSGRLGGGVVVFESTDAINYTLSDTIFVTDGDVSTVQFVSNDELWATDEGLDADLADLSTRNLKVFNFADNTYYTLSHDSIDVRPRGLAVSGETVYVGSFNTGRIARFTLVPSTVAVEDPDGVPDAFVLEQNYPNPFNPTTTIRYTLKEPATVALRVYDATGRLVNTLVSGRTQATGTYEVEWNGTDMSGRTVANGTYFYSLQAGNQRQTRGMVLLK